MTYNFAVVWEVRAGHWRADLYRDTTPEEQRLSGRSPDSFLTRTTEHGARLAAAYSWPDAHQLSAEEEDADTSGVPSGSREPMNRNGE